MRAFTKFAVRIYNEVFILDEFQIQDGNFSLIKEVQTFTSRPQADNVCGVMNGLVEELNNLIFEEDRMIAYAIKHEGLNNHTMSREDATLYLRNLTSRLIAELKNKQSIARRLFASSFT